MRRTGRSSFLAQVTRLLTNARRARVSHHQPAARRTKLDRGASKPRTKKRLHAWQCAASPLQVVLSSAQSAAYGAT